MAEVEAPAAEINPYPCVPSNSIIQFPISNDPERAEYYVRVEWLDTVTEDKAFNEVGLFGNQNTVCQPTTPKWRHTVERLKQQFPKWDKGPKP